MNVVRRGSAVVLAGIVLCAMSALPATAKEVAKFTGTATVCADSVQGKPAAPNCPAGKGNGLYSPTQPGGANNALGFREDITDTGKFTNRRGNYSFTSMVCKLTNTQRLPATKDCVIELSGKIGPVARGVGANCAVTRGWDGVGKIRSLDNNNEIDLWDVEWPSSAGGLIVMKGNYQVVREKQKLQNQNKPDSGQFAAVVQAQGGDKCQKSLLTGKEGATQFNIVGTATMTEAPKKAKEQGPNRLPIVDDCPVSC